jgi:hypothetical protein
MAPRCGDGDRANPAVPDVGQSGRDGVEHHLQPPAHGVDHRGAGAAVGNVLDVDPGHLLQQFHEEVLRAAGTARAVAELAGARSCQG